jgi:4-amino-4-deoxy-L-arabinose transferase-like glycosyltransferase
MLALWLVVGVAAALRLIALPAFPEVVADEGLWTNSSKNWVLFGDWFMDGRKHLFLSPAFHALSVAVFELSHPSIAAARVINGIAGTLSVLMLFFLVQRTTARSDLALASATLLGVTADVAFQSRQALIEPLQLCFLLATALALAWGGTRGALLGGLAFALALLTKLNSLFLAPVLPLFGLGGARLRDALREPAWLARSALFGAVALVLAGAVYAALYHSHPDLFVQAYTFELVGGQFDRLSRPLIRLGRFGFDPAMISRSVLGLLRESPFLMVLFTLGLAFSVVTRSRPARGFAIWALFGTFTVLVQRFQPLRYFHAMVPAYCFFAAAAVTAWRRDESRRPGLLPAAALAVYVLFNLAYLGSNWLANPARRIAAVTSWARQHTRPEDRIVAAAYLCTDLPNRAYAHYYLGEDMAQLAASFDRYAIDYVIVDDSEWTPAVRSELAERYERVQQWPFAEAYRVRARGAR